MSFDKEYFSLGYLDSLSYKDTLIHRLDARVKVIVTSLFILAVASFDRYEIFGLIPYFFFPVTLFALGDIPVAFILKKISFVFPFAFTIAIFNPVFDTHPVFEFIGIPFSGGWISFISVMLKFFLTICSALLLIATTSFPGICNSLQRIGMPDIFAAQLLFLYRYIFVLMEEAMKVVRARDMRSFKRKGRGIRVFIHLAGALFIRTVERSERIYLAMLSRGFDGRIRSLRLSRIQGKDVVFACICLLLFYVFRKYEVVWILGDLLDNSIQ